MQQPAPLMEVRVHDLALTPSVTGLCVGYELGHWRAAQFADHLMEWLPEFALTYSEIRSINPGNMVALMREAAKKLYASEKFANRGEFGEIILHAAIRQVFGSLPAISKIYYKSARNDTVKGFDAVHVVDGPAGLQLWLGEAKFYSDIGSAIRDVAEELRAHTQRDYLRDEFLLIAGKIDDQWPHAEELNTLLSPNTSLDQVFESVCIPVLLTYDSACIANHRKVTDEYVTEFQEEIMRHYETFRKKDLPGNVLIRLFLMPLEHKVELIAELDRKLRGWQGL